MTKYMAQWGPKGFLVDTSKLVPFNDLSTAFTLNSEYRVDTSGNDPIYSRGRALQNITFATEYWASLGVNPRNQMRQWYDLIGMTYPMYISGVQFGPPLLQLISVDLPEFVFDNAGQMLGLKVDITLNEYAGEARTISQKTFDAWNGVQSATDIGPTEKEVEIMKVTVTLPEVST